MRFYLVVLLAALFVAAALRPTAADPIRAGFAKTDITPEVGGEKPVYIAGYGQNRVATGVHDPLYARAVVLDDGEKQIAMVAVDVVGIFYPEVQTIREALPDFEYVMVAATHNHEGPDTMGIWGPSIFKSGIDPDYLAMVRARVIEAVQAAAENLAPSKAGYGTAQDDSLLRDSREPKAYDGVLRVVKFDDSASGKPRGLVVQWNCHPEAMDSKNTEITADFPFATIALLEAKYNCPVVYFSGPVGGLMAPPGGRVFDESGTELNQGTFEYTETYGRQVGELAVKAIDAATPLELAPMAVSAKPITVPLENQIYIAGARFGVLKRPSRHWTGDFEELGELIKPPKIPAQPAMETEVSYLRLGELHVAGIPGEIYPELVYGTYQEPVDPDADFPDAPLEPTVVDTLPGDKMLIIGLANDEMGYIVPKRQWDEKPPFAYGRDKMQYGEVNSVGSEAAPILMQALVNRVRELESE